MPRLLHDPNLDVCPDYALEIFAATRARIVNAHTTEEQAILALREIWQVANDTDKELWQQQQVDDLEEREQAVLREEEQRALEAELLKDEEEVARKEEKKKNKHKYLPILQGIGVPTESPVIPATHVVRKLDKGEYVELWHFMNDGLDDTLDTSTSVDPDAMVMSRLPDRLTAWVSAAAACSSTKLVEDQNLIFEDFCQAAPRFVEAIQQANWPNDRVKMMAYFFRNLQVHTLRSIRDKLVEKVAPIALLKIRSI
ncbi:hypothetical protein BDN67DRAFT_985678 [Paxillus ammoniavirescens]|nr:hypothetical protein BDN67DRAFT_985678 [Paxillus ammoniavirescens]